jgi:serine/threonine protein kinase
MSEDPYSDIYISDMGLCGEVSNIDGTKIYGVMPYVAPEVLKGNPYTQAADIYSFGMIMYFVATGKQPFANCAHDNILALKICNGIRPEINELEAPKCYIDLMKRCWDSNQDNGPNAIEIEELIELFWSDENEEIKKQFEETNKYRKANHLSIKNNQTTTHPQAYYTSRLLNPYTKDLSKYNDDVNNISIEVIDFTK